MSAVTNDDGSVTYALKHKVELRNTAGEVMETLTELTLRRFNGRAMRDIANAKDKGSGEAMTVLVCAAARIPRSQFDQLDAEDVTDAGAIAGNFIGSAPPTSST